MEKGCKHMLAMHMLMGADPDCFGNAVEDFAHAYLMGRKK